MGKISGGYLIRPRRVYQSDLMDKPPLWWKLWDWMLNEARFKDHGKIKRGQFFTTIADMQEAMSYKVGYRKHIPTKDQIRNAYEHFTKTTMITTTKTTRGMVITICNYELYQDIKNYEDHNEDHNEDYTKTTEAPHYNGKKEERKEKFIPPTIEEVRQYAKEKGYDIDAEHFWHHHNTRDWTLKTGKMKNWKSAVTTWAKNNFSKKPKQEGIAGIDYNVNMYGWENAGN